MGRGCGDDLVVATTPLSRTSEARDERMSTRHTMRKIREVLRLKNEQGCSQRQIQAATGLSKGSVAEYLRRTEKAGVTWPMAEALSEADLEARLFKQIGRNETTGPTPTDLTCVNKDLPVPGSTPLH